MRCAGGRGWRGWLCRRSDCAGRALAAADGEGGEGGFGEGLGFDGRDGGVSGAAAAPAYELVETGCVAGGGDLDMAFGGVADPAFDGEAICLCFGGGAVVDALDGSFDQKVVGWHAVYFLR